MSKKPSPKLKGAGAEVVALALAQAKAALSDPETRRAIVEQGRDIADSIRTWQRDQKARPKATSEGPARRDLGAVIGDSFGQGKLEGRVERLRSSVARLSAGRPDLAVALAPVLDSVDKISISLEIAGSLPIVKRKTAHRQIDKALDDLEVGLFQASLPGSPSD